MIYPSFRPITISSLVRFLRNALSLGTIAFTQHTVSMGDVLISLSGTTGSRDAFVTFEGSGSWVSDHQSQFGLDNANGFTANSAHPSLGGIDREGIDDQGVGGGTGNPFAGAVSGGFISGVYVPLDTPIQLTADRPPLSFKIIGLVLDDDNDPAFGSDDLILITDQPASVFWGAGTTYSYAVGSASSITLNSTIGSTFDQAFNPGSYELDKGIFGTLLISDTSGNVDFGDAPYTYGTTLASDGARHEIAGPFLGTQVDSELEGLGSEDATTDDSSGIDDEDGVAFSPMAGFDRNSAVSNSVSLIITNGPADYEIWIDWNIDGIFTFPGELTASGSLPTGSHNVSVAVPATASLGNSIARIRVYSAGTRINSATGLATSGEVEDYPIAIQDTTLVDLLEYDLSVSFDNTVTIRWATGAEIDTAGFNIYRLNENEAEEIEVKINPELYPSAGNTVEGSTYSVSDLPGYGSFTYQLEEVEVSGKSNRLTTLRAEVLPRLRVFNGQNANITITFEPLDNWVYEIQAGNPSMPGSIEWNPIPATQFNSGRIEVPPSPSSHLLYRLTASPK